MNKYHARKTEIDGLVFDSRAEANRYLQLKLLERAGEITDLELQVRYDLRVNEAKVCDYVADFRYRENGRVVVEDVKGYKKGNAYAVFRLKSKLMKAVHGIDVIEIGG